MLINYGSCAVCFILNTTPQRMGDWEYTPIPDDDTVILNKYVGTNTDVVVPTNIHADIVITTRDDGSIADNVTVTEDAGSVGDSILTQILNAGNI